MSKISVIVPVHNTEKYLRKCVASLTAQTYGHIEIILVENASSDGSLALCHELASHDDRIKVIHADIGDPAHARNEGVKASTGEYIGFVDSDDTVEPDMYEQMLSLAEKSDLDIVFCDFVKTYDYRTNRFEFASDGTAAVGTSKEFLEKIFKDQIPNSVCTLLCRRRLFNDVHFPVGRYYEDTATTWRLVLAARTAGYIARPLYHYYRHSGSIVHTPSFKIHYGHVLADMERIDFINSCPEYSAAEKMELGSKSLALFYRHFRKMIVLADSEAEKEICFRCREWLMSLPKGYKLKFKYAMISQGVRNYWNLFCIAHRGKTMNVIVKENQR